LQSQAEGSAETDSVSLSSTRDKLCLLKALPGIPIEESSNASSNARYPYKETIRLKLQKSSKILTDNVLDSSIVLGDLEDRDLPKLSSLSICTSDASGILQYSLDSFK